jgi:hypothetical protein
MKTAVAPKKVSKKPNVGSIPSIATATQEKPRNAVKKKAVKKG